MLLLPVKRMGVQAALFTVCLEAAKQLFVGTFCSLKNFLWPMGLQVFGHLSSVDLYLLATVLFIQTFG